MAPKLDLRQEVLDAMRVIAREEIARAASDGGMHGVVAAVTPDFEVTLVGDVTSTPIPLKLKNYSPAEGDRVRVVRVGKLLAAIPVEES